MAATKPKTATDLNSLYREAESVDKALFAEQRSNILLVTGDHYSKKGSRFWERVKSNQDLSQDQKIRITKNHIHRICNIYHNGIVSYAPSVAIEPKNKSEIQDQKKAELHSSVWQHFRQKHRLRQATRDYGRDFITIGEVAVKIFYDPNAGEFIGYEQEVDDFGQPKFERDETGMYQQDANGEFIPIVSDRPVFSGDLVFERVFAFNLLRAPEAKTIQESPYVIIRKMVNTETLKARYAGDEAKQKLITSGQDQTFKVFDGARGSYTDSKNETLLMEFYYRPCHEYPRGYFYFATTDGILEEGELPFGIWPIAYAGFDEVPTTPRHRSLIKQLRPYQAEINRASSKVAEHQVSLGDDKIIYQAGSKMANGSKFPGVRGIEITGPAPTILAGRSGEQYLPYIAANIAEMYQAANLDMEELEVTPQADPFTLLFASMRHKKKFSIYAEKFEQFLVDFCEITLRTAKANANDAWLIPAIGKKEYINIEEFKSSDDLSYEIKLEPQTDDIETKMGQQLALNHLIQFTGSNLSKEDIGKIARQMPYVNGEEMLEDLTIDYDNIRNDMLALDRGQWREPHPDDNHVYVIQKLTNRMKKPDFEFLDPKIQQMYTVKRAQHEQLQATRLQQLKAAESEFIPTGGYSVALDFYVPHPNDPLKTQRARLPYESISWLMERLQAQGMDQEAIKNLPESAQAGIANAFVGGTGQMAQGPGRFVS